MPRSWKERGSGSRSSRASSSASTGPVSRRSSPSAGSPTAWGSNGPSWCIRRGSIRSTCSATVMCAGPSSTTSGGRSAKVPASGKSVKPSAPRTEQSSSASSSGSPSPSPKRQPKPPKADRDLWVFERQAFGLGYATVAGVDEAGMGPWAGPVAAAVVLRPFFESDGINDSKLLTAEQREAYYPQILQHAESWGVGLIEVDEIDRVGVRRAGRMAMALALQRLGRRLDYLLVDGFRLPEALLPQLPIIKGDRRSISIMSAGIIAKVTRDRRMVAEAERFPAYGFQSHKGYPTPEELAEDHLRGLGYGIRGRDVRTPIGQLDLVATDGPTLVFVEVKTRAGLGFGLPEEAIAGHKSRKLRQLAQYYLKRHPHAGPLRFDVVGIIVEDGRVSRLTHIKNALD